LGAPLTADDLSRLAPLDARHLLREAGLHPQKSLGQNFLVDEKALAHVAEIAEIEPVETILEIGAGLGSLTRHLAVRAHRVVALEIDPALLPLLHRVLSPFANVAVIQGDILAQPVERLLGEVPSSGYAVVANIPYYITSAIIRHLMEACIPPSRIVLTVQEEVAERICALPGAMSLLALSVQYYGHPEICGKIPARAFYPRPQVDSAVVKITLDSGTARNSSSADGFFRVAKAGFSQKRKMLRNTLSAGLRVPVAEAEKKLLLAGIDSRRRAETLSVDDWIAVAREFIGMGAG
jgi:16S rRNA (adenine1518-N6/adenine1519-N6)-dimethyltransferase